MRRLTWMSYSGALLAAGLLASLASPAPAAAQSGWAAEPTYRFPGHYEGEWTAEVAVDAVDSEQAWPTLFEQRAGEMRGTLVVDVGCDGAISGQAQGQTRLPVALAGFMDGIAGPRVLSATLHVVTEGNFAGSLATRRGDGTSGRVEAALDGTVHDLPSELESAAGPSDVHRYYNGAVADQWALLEGEPGRLAGSFDGVGALSPPSDLFEPGLRVRSRGQWVASRLALTLCPWRGSVLVSGALGNQQLHEERVELTFRPTADGRLEGEGLGEATIRGGPPGGCEYSGGGPFAVHVVGEHRGGVFRLRLEDYEQPQLVITTTCAAGRYTAPHPTLSTLFGTIELPEEAGAQARATLPETVPDARGTLDVTIAPVIGAAPP